MDTIYKKKPKKINLRQQIERVKNHFDILKKQRQKVKPTYGTQCSSKKERSRSKVCIHLLDRSPSIAGYTLHLWHQKVISCTDITDTSILVLELWNSGAISDRSKLIINQFRLISKKLFQASKKFLKTRLEQRLIGTSYTMRKLLAEFNLKF